MESPAELGLPARFPDWRPGQAEIIEEISSSGSKFFLLDAPTGTGKSVIGIASYLKRRDAFRVMERFNDEEPKKHRCVYVTKTKQLQDQILREFPDARSMKGRGNYPCLKHPDKFPEYTAEQCSGSKEFLILIFAKQILSLLHLARLYLPNLKSYQI